MINAYHESVEMSLMKRHMAYTEADFQKDWDQMVALALMMSVDGETDTRRRIMEDCSKRVRVYIALHPYVMPEKKDLFGESK